MHKRRAIQSLACPGKWNEPLGIGLVGIREGVPTTTPHINSIDTVLSTSYPQQPVCVFNTHIFCRQSGISIDTTGTTHLAGYSCITGLRCGSIDASSRGGLEKILSENLQEIFPYSWRKGQVPRRNSQKSFRIPNHPVKKMKIDQSVSNLTVTILKRIKILCLSLTT